MRVYYVKNVFLGSSGESNLEPLIEQDKFNSKSTYPGLGMEGKLALNTHGRHQAAQTQQRRHVMV